MVKYKAGQVPRHRHPLRRLGFVVLIGLIILAVATFFIRRSYDHYLGPVSDDQTIKLVTINSGESTDQIANTLYKAGLIRSSWVFEWYVGSKEDRDKLEAGTYALRPSQDVATIVSQLTQGKVAIKLVTILPDQRLDQITQSLINSGFSPASVQAALNPALYTGNPALVDKPPSASLEGYLYPDSFDKNDNTNVQTIIEESLSEMSERLTPSLRAAFAAKGLSTYQGIILASMVGQEASDASDQTQIAQVFLTRLRDNMTLGSDVTAYYGAILAGQPPSVSYNSPYNTLLHTGFPPTPISNVNAQALNSAAHPASTNWLYFVAGDNGKVYFSQTLAQQEANTATYCHQLCSQAN
ncbi:MAG TPA: endolytic transglycosylase MltG [Candidatus Binatia bacterium]|nr:endolytic transglycosylase MltG [Candidatus Binatia bacterium]